MDATGSMGHLLDQVKNTICVMFERATDVLEEYSLPADSFEIQLVVYRDYDSLESVLQVSGWEIKPLNLRNFMNTVTARGGGDYEEAIEVGLWHVNQEQSKLKDPNFLNSLKTEFLKTELETIKANSIPVHTFYVMKGAEECFAEIAFLTGGQTGFLDVNSSNGADRLIDLITPLILNDVGTINGGMGSRLVEEYKKKYPKSYA
ncbi:unnamed protein product [Brachionus calyciflorus]|uniref:Uncharacterized protein n=1 Tax=Brachionus calyciflorus TaxID=104777 RepID=A0A813MAA5_9BILA|nr:unnamed protein product [Brachionus calyciflorus]